MPVEYSFPDNSIKEMPHVHYAFRPYKSDLDGHVIANMYLPIPGGLTSANAQSYTEENRTLSTIGAIGTGMVGAVKQGAINKRKLINS